MEVAALLKHVTDADVRDFTEWGFRTGMRKGEIAKLELYVRWDSVDCLTIATRGYSL